MEASRCPKKQVFAFGGGMAPSPTSFTKKCAVDYDDDGTCDRQIHA